MTAPSTPKIIALIPAIPEKKTILGYNRNTNRKLCLKITDTRCGDPFEQAGGPLSFYNRPKRICSRFVQISPRLQADFDCIKRVAVLGCYYFVSMIFVKSQIIIYGGNLR